MPALKFSPNLGAFELNLLNDHVQQLLEYSLVARVHATARVATWIITRKMKKGIGLRVKRNVFAFLLSHFS